MRSRLVGSPRGSALREDVTHASPANRKSGTHSHIPQGFYDESYCGAPTTFPENGRSTLSLRLTNDLPYGFGQRGKRVAPDRFREATRIGRDTAFRGRFPVAPRGTEAWWNPQPRSIPQPRRLSGQGNCWVEPERATQLTRWRRRCSRAGGTRIRQRYREETT